MKVTISELRSMIREALQEKMYQEDMGGEAPPAMEEAVYQENMSPVNEDAALEEAWNELEEAAGVVEEKKEGPLTETIRALVRKTLLEAKKAEEKEEKPKAKKEEKPKAEKEEKPKAEKAEPAKAKKEEEQDKGMYSLSVSQLKAMKKLDNNDFNKCLSHMKKGMPVGMALRVCRAKEERD